MAIPNQMYGGKAYGIFCCNAWKKEVLSEIVNIRKAVETPSTLEVTLTQGSASDPRINALVAEVGKFGPAYILQAAYKPGENGSAKLGKKPEVELGAILNQAYQSDLYKANEPFIGEIAYKERGKHAYLN